MIATSLFCGIPANENFQNEYLESLQLQGLQNYRLSKLCNDIVLVSIKRENSKIDKEAILDGVSVATACHYSMQYVSLSFWRFFHDFLLKCKMLKC